MPKKERTYEIVTRLTKRALIYAAGDVDYARFVQDYANSGGVTALGPQVYGLDDNGNITNNLSLTYPYNDPTFAANSKALGIDIVPLIAAGSGLGSNFSDSGIRAIINSASTFADSLISLCKSLGYHEIQLDWETELASSATNQMTLALAAITSAMHQAGFQLSLTTYLSNFNVVYNTLQLAPLLDNLNIQAYTGNLQIFQNSINSMLERMPQQYFNRLQVGMGDYPDVNPPIAGACVQFLLSKGIQSIAIWPKWGNALSNGAFGYSDTYYGTNNFGELSNLFLNH